MWSVISKVVPGAHSRLRGKVTEEMFVINKSRTWLGLMNFLRRPQVETKEEASTRHVIKFQVVFCRHYYAHTDLGLIS